MSAVKSLVPKAEVLGKGAALFMSINAGGCHSIKRAHWNWGPAAPQPGTWHLPGCVMGA